MPVSSTRRKAKPQTGRKVIAKRTSGWSVLTGGRNTVAAIMTSVRALATIAIDAKTIGISEEDQEIVKAALTGMQTALVVNPDTKETVLMRTEAAYSAGCALVSRQPYIKESQLGPHVNVVAEMVQYTLGMVLPHLGALSDIFSLATNMSDYHLSLLKLNEDAMLRVAGKPTGKESDF